MSAPFPALCLFGLVLLASGNTAACEWDSHKVEVNSTEIHFDTCNSYFSRTKLWDYRVLAERLDSSLPHSVSGTAKLVWQMEREGSASERGAKIVSRGQDTIKSSNVPPERPRRLNCSSGLIQRVP